MPPESSQKRFAAFEGLRALSLRLFLAASTTSRDTLASGTGTKTHSSRGRVVVAELELAGRLVPDLASRGLARVPRPKSVNGPFVQARRHPGLHEHRDLLVGVWGINLAPDDVPDGRVVPPTDPGRRRYAVPLQRDAHGTNRHSFRYRA